MIDINLINGIALAFEGDAVYSMLEEDVLTVKEVEIYKRGRNTNSHTKAKNADVVTYRMSTGFEAVMGYLHLTNEISRLEELVAWCIQKVEEGIK